MDRIWVLISMSFLMRSGRNLEDSDGLPQRREINTPTGVGFRAGFNSGTA